jgi:hypothetical protein
MFERRAHLVGPIAHHRLVHHVDAEPVELIGEEKRIGVEAVGRQQFGANCNNFRVHALAVLLDGDEPAQAATAQMRRVILNKVDGLCLIPPAGCRMSGRVVEESLFSCFVNVTISR